MYQTVRRIHDGLRRAVVLLQFEQTRGGVQLLKLQDVVDVRPAERIDALCVIANNTDVLVVRRQLLHDAMLRIVRILILVDQHIAEPLFILCQHVRARLEQSESI